MTDSKTRQAILKMREDGTSYAEIADFFSLSPNTVKSICYRNGVQTSSGNCYEAGLCKNCGKPLSHPPGDGRRLFCSNQCRYQWWNHSRSRKPYHLTCYCCGKEFISFGNRKKKFCSQECYRRNQAENMLNEALYEATVQGDKKTAEIAKTFLGHIKRNSETDSDNTSEKK